MHYLVAPELQLVFGWSPKCGCTTIKQSLLTKLGFSIEGNVHNDMLTRENLRSGVFGLWDVGSVPSVYDWKSYEFVGVMRDPFRRFMSGLRQRGFVLLHAGLGDMTISELLMRFEAGNFEPDPHHFEPQAKGLLDRDFDELVDLSDMQNLFARLKLPYYTAESGGHQTNYVECDEPYHELSIGQILKKRLVSERRDDWFSQEAQELIREVYKDDFDLARRWRLGY